MKTANQEKALSKLLSVIIPSYNEEGNVENTAKTVLAVLDGAGIESELIFVSDGSRDNTFEIAAGLAEADSRIRCVEFSRNFGKEAAIFAGLSEGSGDCLVIMDCDLQHPPETIVEMYRLWEQGYEIVEGKKKNRGKESVFHRAFAGLFYGILTSLTGFNMQNASDFKLVDKRVANTLVAMPERQTFFRALTFWTGYKSCQVFYEVAPRSVGKSKWSVRSLVRYALTNIISFSSMPLKLVSYIGTSVIFLSVLLGIQTLVRYIMGNAIEGFTTVILLQLFIGGCVLTGIGIIGRYLAAIYEEVKGRPRYLISRDTRKDANNKNE